MGSQVSPQAYLIGESRLVWKGLERFCKDADIMSYYDEAREWSSKGVSDMVILCSTNAKLCYRSWREGQNLNITKIRTIPDNFKGIIDTSHGSCLEHGCFNFLIRNCSRVFTHELVRHRVGIAFSQTSGRFVRGEDFDLVWDTPIMSSDPDVQEFIDYVTKFYIRMCERYGLNSEGLPFNEKKKLTSKMRRLLPNGIANDIGVSLNMRTMRHLVALRSQAAAEVEIRLVVADMYEQAKESVPLLFFDANERLVDGIKEIYGMKQQPYEMTREQLLQSIDLDLLKKEVERREKLTNETATTS